MGNPKPPEEKVYRVFVAGPRDVQVQRDATHAFFDDYSRSTGRHRGFRLEVLDWERDAVRGVGAPQARINAATLEPFADSLVLFVGIMAQRYGSGPNGSFTVEEFELAMKLREANGHPDVLWFFRTGDRIEMPDDPDDFAVAAEQYQQVCAFRKRLDDGEPKHFVCEYRAAQFESELHRQVTRWLEKPERPWHSAGATESAAPTPDGQLDLTIYRQRLEAALSTLPLVGFGPQQRVPIQLDEVYVPLTAQIDMRALCSEADGGITEFADSGDAIDKLGGHPRDPDVPLIDAFRLAHDRGQRRGIVIVGDPGSGKTTHLKRLGLWLLKRDPTKLGLPADCVPLFLPLREFGDPDRALEDFVAAAFRDLKLELDAAFAKQLLDDHAHLLFLLDGLDEVANVAIRARVKERINALRTRFPRAHFAVTCRYAGYTGDVRLSEHFLGLHLRPLSDGQVEDFVTRWYATVERNVRGPGEQTEAVARDQTHELLERLRSKDFRAARVYELTHNPLLLTAICLVHRDRKALPDRRAELYQECVRVLLERWREKKPLGIAVGPDQARQALQPLARWLHDEEERTRATEAELAPILEQPLARLGEGAASPAEFLKTIRDESGLLTGWSDSSYGFMHLGFQEYLAALAIRSDSHGDKAVLDQLAAQFGSSWWREVTLLLLALGDPPLFEPLMTRIVKLPQFAKHPELVAIAVHEAAGSSAEPFVELLTRPHGDNGDLWQRQLTAWRLVQQLAPERLTAVRDAFRTHPLPELRALAGGEATATHRAGESGVELVRIPGGTFWMGSRESERGHHEDETPRHEVDVPEFALARHPVTNEQYGAFLAAVDDVESPEYWGDKQFNRPNQPVVGVSWHDAQRYCAWAGLRLPSEAEWEYACRARTESRFWSGNGDNDLARIGWFDGNSGGRLHPVGEKEPNEFGLVDMHGNVFEWCQDQWHGNYTGAPTDGSAWEAGGSAIRVIRGGSFDFSAGDCRSAFRDVGHPGYRWGFLGFRPAASSLDSPHHITT